MSRTVTGLMQTPTGDLSSGSMLQLTLPNGVVYETLLIDTNIPYAVLKKLSVMNGSDDFRVTSGAEIIDVFEKHRNRNLTSFIPIRFSDPDANGMEAQDATALICEHGESWLLQIELDTLPETVPQGGWYLKVWSETSPIVRAVKVGVNPDGSDKIQMIRRQRVMERRLDRKVLTAGVEGENTFDKLIKGPGINIRTVYMKGKGAINEVEFEGKRDGQIVHRWKLTSKLNTYLQKIRGQKNGISDVSGYFIYDPIATGFSLADMDSTLYDELILKIDSAASGSIEIVTDYVKKLV